MEAKDHAALARLFINQTDNKMLLRHKTAFFIGCIEPDLNPFTYMRGSFRYKLMRGHNAENAQAHIRKYLNRIQNQKPNSNYDFFALGTLIHYIADSFTFPHNKTFNGTMKDHIAYEKMLNPVFMKALGDYTIHSVESESTGIYYSFSKNHDSYLREPESIDKDCQCIISVCTNIFCTAVRQVEVLDMQIGRSFYENSYYNRLV